MIKTIKIDIRAVKERLNPFDVPTVTLFDMKFKYRSDPVDSRGNGNELLNASPPISGSDRESPSCTLSTSSLNQNNSYCLINPILHFTT